MFVEKSGERKRYPVRRAHKRREANGNKGKGGGRRPAL